MIDTLEELVAARGRLHSAWTETRELWRDSVQQRFEREYWQPIEETTKEAIRAVETMAETLARMDRELSDR